MKGTRVICYIYFLYKLVDIYLNEQKSVQKSFKNRKVLVAGHGN